MTDASFVKQPLGIGAIIGETFSLFFKNIIWATVIAIIPVAIVIALTAALLGVGFVTGAGDPDVFATGFGISAIIVMILQIVGYSVALAMLVSFAYDRKLGRPARIGAYFSNALGNIIPLVILSMVVAIGIYAGMILLIIPGLWVYAVWSVVVPAVVIDNSGFGALGRSARLTKEYRWPILGLMIVAMIAAVIFIFIVMFVVGIVDSILGFPALSIIFMILIYSFMYGFLAILIALLYARLREIKEGVSVDHLADVFS